MSRNWEKIIALILVFVIAIPVFTGITMGTSLTGILDDNGDHDDEDHGRGLRDKAEALEKIHEATGKLNAVSSMVIPACSRE
jgi:hypothetical protein